ncbi:MAG: ECF transporter S component [Lachnospiraceae bacterium]|nr:ECF transporter S component [Lachnospiraceae bacterium]
MKTKKLILTALFTALTTVATMVIHIPTPTMGYIHPGDALVLLSGILLGPLAGAFAAGVGSALSDLFGGYFIYVPATLIIKGLTAWVAYYVFREIKKLFSKDVPATIIGGVVGETIMVIGYFVFEIFMLAFTTGDGLSASGIASGIAASASGVPFNVVQGIVGIILATILYPLLKRLETETINE